MTTRCAAEQRCHGYDRRSGLPAWADHGLCADCLFVAGNTIPGLVYDYVDLEQAIVGVKRGGEPVSGTKEQILPLAVGIEAMQRSIWLITTTWEDVVREAVGLPIPLGKVRDGYAVQRAVNILEPRLPLLADIGPTAVMPYGPDAGPAELTGAEGIIGMMVLHGAVRSALGLTRLVNEMPGECSECGLSTLRMDDQGEEWALRRDNGSETVYCGNCGARWTWDDYRRYVELTIAFAERRRR